MNPETILSRMKSKTTTETGTIATKLHVTQYDNRVYWIRDKSGQGVKVTFKEPRRLTIFEAGLLYSIIKGKKPRDYAEYHKCIAGQKFFDSIKEITILQQSTHIIEGETIE